MTDRFMDALRDYIAGVAKDEIDNARGSRHRGLADSEQLAQRIAERATHGLSEEAREKIRKLGNKGLARHLMEQNRDDRRRGVSW